MILVFFKLNNYKFVKKNFPVQIYFYKTIQTKHKYSEIERNPDFKFPV